MLRSRIFDFIEDLNDFLKVSLVTLKKSHIGTELFVLKTRLESEGIKCYMKNEYTTQIMSYMPSFEVELQVSAMDLEKARQIMQEKGKDQK